MIAEKAVLGSMLKENYLIAESNLTASQFTDPTNRTIFQSMMALRIRRESCRHYHVTHDLQPTRFRRRELLERPDKLCAC